MKNQLDIELQAGFDPNQEERHLKWRVMSWKRVETSWLLVAQATEGAQSTKVREVHCQVGGWGFSIRISSPRAKWQGWGEEEQTADPRWVAWPNFMRYDSNDRSSKRRAVSCLHFQVGLWGLWNPIFSTWDVWSYHVALFDWIFK